MDENNQPGHLMSDEGSNYFPFKKYFIFNGIIKKKNILFLRDKGEYVIREIVWSGGGTYSTKIKWKLLLKIVFQTDFSFSSNLFVFAMVFK